MKKESRWVPFSTVAYGANALYVPWWGEPAALEFILVMFQNYPRFKTHPALDFYHGYVQEFERFEKNHEFRVLGWQIDLKERCWSFLYLPEKRPDIRTLASFSASAEGRMRLDLDMQNPGDEEREWQFHIYCAPHTGPDIPGFKQLSFNERRWKFDCAGIKMELASKTLTFTEIQHVASNFWINFPANVENAFNPEDPANPYKKRLLLKTFPVIIGARSSSTASIDFFPDGTSKRSPAPKKVNWPQVKPEELPFLHEWWEALHNRQYVRSFSHDRMTARCIAARQWGRFYIWDQGMGAVGAVEEDEEFASEIIGEMPDPEKCPDDVFYYGSFIVTALYALWELYQKTENPEYLDKHYQLMRRLVMAMYSWPDFEPGPGHDGMVRSKGNRNGVDDNPSSVYADGWPFAWDYEKPLAVNPDRVPKTLIQIGMTSLAVRCLKILRLAAHVLSLSGDVKYYNKLIEKSETVLNRDYWSKKRRCFLERIEGEKELLDIPWLYDYLPLYSSSVGAERQEKLLQDVLSEKKYWTPYGLTVVAQDDKNYRDGYWNGSVWIPPQWFFWKAFYNIGEMDAAGRLSDNVLSLWERNHEESLCCWEKFNVRSGRGAGNSRFSGLSAPILSMWRARRRYGRIQTGQDVLIQKDFDVSTGTLKAELTPPFFSGKTGMSAVLKGDTAYRIIINGKEKEKIRTDSYGYLAFSFEINEKDILRIEISPV